MAVQDTGWLSPSTTLNDLGWMNPANVYALDSVYAVGMGMSGMETPYHRIYQFGGAGGLAAAVSTATAILGIEVRINGQLSAIPPYSYMFVGNAPSGAPQNANGSEKSMNTMPISPSAFAYTTWGGPTDLWGGKQGGGSWVKADFDNNFGVSGAWAGPVTVTIDHIQLKIYFDAPSTLRSRTMMMGV